MVITPTNIEAKFLAFGLLANYILEYQLIPLSMRAAQPHLNSEELGITFVLLPPKKEVVIDG